MKLIKPNTKITSHVDGEEILKQIELNARTCYKSEDKIEYEFPYGTDEQTRRAKSARPLIQKLIKMGHEAMLEFGGTITVKFICDRGVSHELVRHRVASFAQESTRYCNYGKDEHIQFIIPCWMPDLQNDVEFKAEEPNMLMWLTAMEFAEKHYNFLIKNGWSPQQARSVLPNSLKTEINISANIREWRHILKLRTANAAHPQMQELMRPLLKKFQTNIPILFDDITY